MREFLGLGSDRTGPFPRTRLGNAIARLIAVAVCPVTFLATGHLHTGLLQTWQRLTVACVVTLAAGLAIGVLSLRDPAPPGDLPRCPQDH